ncbi:MAG: hypothetical protein QXL15_03305, partial [Candidatus Korarchaeota archaeon]
MPRGIVAAVWSDDLGVVVKGVYPNDLEYNRDDLLRIFTAHATGEGEAGFLAMRLVGSKIASYYSGYSESEQKFISLFLHVDEDPELFQDTLPDVAASIFNVINSSELDMALADAFNKLTRLSTMSLEQRLALIFKDPIRRVILQRLTEGPILKSEMSEWLERDITQETVNLDAILGPLIRAKIIYEDWVEGMPGKVLFLVRDVFATRVPPEKIVAQVKEGIVPKDLGDRYLSDLKNFFQNYKPRSDEVWELSKIITDPDVYDTLMFLRSRIP